MKNECAVFCSVVEISEMVLESEELFVAHYRKYTEGIQSSTK